MAKPKQTIADAACIVADFAVIFQPQFEGARIGGPRIVSEFITLFFFRIVAVEGLLPD
jgi:hypothetical protein